MVEQALEVAVSDECDDIATSAKTLSRIGSSQGGRARAERLTHEERSEIARRAAEKRWGVLVQTAPHSGEMVIGDRPIKCAVLEDGTRLINQQTFLRALGRARSAKGGTGGTTSDVPPFLTAANLRKYVSEEVKELSRPIPYIIPGQGRAVGYRAEILPAICEIYLDAENEGKLLKSQEQAALAARILYRGLARTGIVALIDEATGYQEVRARFELQRILEAYVQAELRPWIKTFPDEFFKEVYRLQGWDYRPGTSKRTPYVGKLVNHYIYEQLPPGILDELRRLNPRLDKGYRAHRHFQFLSADTGNVHLDRQISTVTTLMRIARNQQEFMDLFERAFPPAQARLPLIIDVPAEDS
jgi:hypothetical protein